MKNKDSFASKLRKTFSLIVGLFVFVVFFSILGTLGIGNKNVNVVFGIIMLIVVIFIVLKQYRNLVTNFLKPLLEIEDAIHYVSQGNLDIEVEHTANNEIGHLADSVRELISNLKLVIKDLVHIIKEFQDGNFNVKSQHEEAYVGDFSILMEELVELVKVFSDTMGKIDNAAEQVSMGSHELADSSQDLAQGASDEAKVVEDLLKTVSDVTAQVIENTQTTDMAHSNAKVIEEQAQISKAKMAELTEAMENIKTTSAQIASIITDIEDIASQTNLLSLNAAIEAARAGEAGRGFSVVAEQIRTLAENSAKSAISTKELIDKAIAEVEKGNEISGSTAQSLNHVISEMDKLVLAVADIRAASDKQAESVKGIETSVEQINDVVKTTSATAQETSATSQELSAQAINLKELVSQFQLRED